MCHYADHLSFMTLYQKWSSNYMAIKSKIKENASELFTFIKINNELLFSVGDWQWCVAGIHSFAHSPRFFLGNYHFTYVIANIHGIIGTLLNYSKFHINSSANMLTFCVFLLPVLPSSSSSLFYFYSLNSYSNFNLLNNLLLLS